MESLGLDRETETVYRTVLERSEWGVSELAECLAQSEEQILCSLGRLADLFLVHRRDGTPSPWCAVEPELGLKALMARQEADLARCQQQVQESRSVVAEFLAQSSSRLSRPSSGAIKTLDGRMGIRLWFEQQLRYTESEIAVLSPGGTLSEIMSEGLQALAPSTLARGVRIRVLCLDSVGNDAASSAHCRQLNEFGGELRTTTVLPLHMVIADRSAGAVPLNPDLPAEGVVVASSPGLVMAMSGLFEQLWATAAPWGTPPQRDENGLSPQERELLSLLNSGLTDQGAARKLGVSLRTVRRIMSEMMARTNVKTRFQLAVLAGEREWLQNPGQLDTN